MTIEFPPHTTIGRNALTVLASLPLFEKLDPEALIAIAEQVEWFCLPGGATLFEQDERADSLYAVTSGTLGAIRSEAGGEQRLIGRIKRGETVGESALVSDSRRTATVVALRDTEILRFSKSAFDKMVREYPTAMLHIARLTVARLEQSLRLEHPRAASKAFAIVGVSDGVDEKAFASDLAAEFSRLGKTEVLTRDSVVGHSSSWFNEVESQHDFLLLAADHRSPTWTRQCVAQADTVIYLADVMEKPRMLPVPQGPGTGLRMAQNAELVLLQRRIIRAGAARHWLSRFPAAQHHHVRSKQDRGRLVRLITGNAVGLVLSGGGARGFAHIGVIKAIREAGIEIDLCGGTSVGSIIAAGVAACWDDKQLIERHRRTFVAQNPIGDYTLPLMSLASGRRVSRLLKGEVGSIDISDLPLPYFCISTNLTNACVMVHRSGQLWRCLRASVAIPGVLPPVFQDGEILVDGSVLNNLPVDVMHRLGRGPVIGVDVGSQQSLAACDDVDDVSWFGRLRLIRERRAPSILQLLLRSGSLSSALVTASNRQASNLLLTPRLEGIDVLDWKAFDRAIEAGYRYASERMQEIAESITRPGDPDWR